MHFRALTLATLALACVSTVAFGQSFSARRTAMGGVVLPSGGPGSDASNVAYRVVPSNHEGGRNVPLPLGLIPVLANPPSFDPKSPDFNAYELLNLISNPPWNLQLVKPQAPTGDVVVSIGRDYMSIKLDELSQIFPKQQSRLGSVVQMPSLGYGLRWAFAGLSMVGQYQNDLRMNDPLFRALSKGEPVTTNTDYVLNDDVVGQLAAALQMGAAMPLMQAGNPRVDGWGLYGGARVKILRGLAYGEARNQMSFTTSDTLFSSAPLALDYGASLRKAGPGGGGFGRSLDLGAVWLSNGLELGIGINDIAARLPWHVEESVAQRDSATGEVRTTVTGRDVAFTSKLPSTITVNAARQIAGTLFVADLVNGLLGTSYHVGAERWIGPVAWRSGLSVDTDSKIQFAGGAGFKLGKFGLDLGAASHSRNVSHERGVELGAGLALSF
jgi:hypothetical protein